MNLAVYNLLCSRISENNEPIPENKELTKVIKIMSWLITGMLLLFMIAQLRSAL